MIITNSRSRIQEDDDARWTKGVGMRVEKPRSKQLGVDGCAGFSMVTDLRSVIPRGRSPPASTATGPGLGFDWAPLINTETNIPDN